MKNTTLLVQLGDDRDSGRDEVDYFDPILTKLQSAGLHVFDTASDFDEGLECEVAVFEVEASAKSVEKAMKKSPFEYVIR